jgi:putative colanic acid biosynthesis UDP-glucose lipid carrier transferase
MMFHGRSDVEQTSISSLVVGLSYALTIVGMLQICIWIHPTAELMTFRYVSLVGGLLGFFIYSRPRHNTINAQAISVHSFLVIIRLWLSIFFVIILVNYLTKSGQEFSRAVMMMWCVSTPLALMLTSILCRSFLLRIYNSRKIARTAVFIGFSEDAQQLAAAISQARLMGIVCIGYFDNRTQPRNPLNVDINNLGTLEQACTWLAQHPVDMVFISLVNARSKELAPVVEMLQDTVTSLYFVPESRMFGMAPVEQAEIAGVPVLVAYETPFLGMARVTKRLFDIVFSTVILVLLSPLMLVIAVGIKLSSPGPILFRQKRYGIGGGEINVLKFRSMRYDESQEVGSVKQATAEDARVTPFGRFLRKSSLDELPQFFNVLAGTMSIVGPRPHATQHNELYRKQIKGYMLRHKVKPGITGWAQIHGLRGETETLDKMQKRIEFDLYYIRNWSLTKDLVIMLKTIVLIFKDRHAY